MRLLVAVLAALVTAAWLAPAAFGVDSVYWGSYSGGAIRVGNLDGSGTAQDVFTGENYPEGVALDPAAGTIYWTSYGAGNIRVGNLDGSGTPHDLFTGEPSPQGLALDPVGGKIYWTSFTTGAIRVGNLDGSGSAQDLFTGENHPDGVALDPAAGKIYWAANAFGGAIRVANLDGSGTAHDLFTGENGPSGVALDPAAGKIYWVAGGGIRVGNLDGSGTAHDLFTGESNPYGLALDPAAGKIYWAGGGAIRVGNLDGSGTAHDLFTGETDPEFLALVRSPRGTGVPAVTGASSVGSMLSCSEGSWAADLLGALLYRAPRSFSYQWTFNGADIAGATSSTYTAPAAGSYACGVTASNQAGSGSQTSAPFTVTGAGTPPPTVALALAHVSQSHRRWREGKALPHIASVRPPVGTTFRFTLNESVRVRFVFKRRLLGRRVGGRCVAPTAKNRRKPKCTRLVTRGALSFSAGAGAHKLRFQGRLSKHKRLPLGRYTVLITATNSAAQRATAKLTFTIVA